MRRSIVSRFAGIFATPGKIATAGFAALGMALASMMTGGTAMAQNTEGGMVGAPVPWGMGLQQAAGPVKEAVHDFNQLVLWIIVAVTIFVGVLLAYVVWKFRASANPVPSRTSHHTLLEVAWTVAPVLILIVIAIPSFRLIYYMDRTRDAELTVNVTGRQWYWHYAYPDQGNFAFDSYPIAEADLKPGQLRNLEVDNALVIPVGKDIRVITTGQDVIHSFFVPSLGVQKYTIPGRTMETWMRADRVGTFYGQCNQICGQNHWFMPIVVKALPQAEYETWLAGAKQRFATNDAAPAPLAVASETAPATGVAAAAPEARQLADLRR